MTEGVAGLHKLLAVTESPVRYLHGQLIESQRKYAFFLLAAAASAVGLAVNQTDGAQLSITQAPLAAGVVCWGLSFFFGCRHLAYISATLRANAEAFVIEAGNHPDVPRHPDYISAASEGTREAAHGNAEGANRNAKRQFRFLVAGALLYIAWHVLEMAARTPGISLPGL